MGDADLKVKGIKETDAAGNVINPAKEDGNLATIAGKDFATETTLALVKAKTDNIPADPAREGGNLATIAGDTTSIDGKITDGTQQTKIKETIPTDATKNNGSFAYTYDVSGNLTQIDQTIGAVTYRKTLTYDGSNNLIAMSVWSVV